MATIDWTPVATAGVATVGTALGGLIGYLTAWRQADVEQYGIDAETERLRLAQEEQHLQSRSAAYHEFLRIANSWHLAMIGIRPFEGEGVGQWFDEFEYRSTAVALFGTEEARGAAQALADNIASVIRDKGVPRLTDRERIAVADQEEFVRLWHAVIDAMRPDTTLRLPRAPAA